MGKRKSSKKPVAKKARPKLEKTFNCPFCNAHNSVECRVDRAARTGSLACGVCSASYSTVADDLTEDYAAWIDACEEANKKDAEEAAEAAAAGAARPAARRAEKEEEEEDE